MKRKQNERSEAKWRGMTKYFTGRPCKHGHIAERQTQSGSCVICSAGHYKNWANSNPGAARSAHLKWTSEHPGEINIRVNQWRADNPEGARVHSHRRRARTKECDFTVSDIIELMKVQRGKCAHCRAPLNGKYHIDHIVPLARGGLNIKINIQISCPPCNRKKNAKDPIDFARECGRLL